MKRFGRFIACMLAALLCAMPHAGALTEQIAFSDDLGRELSIPMPRRVAVASGSLAECWLLAGGDICAVTQDARERGLPVPEDAIDLGSLKNPSLEVILSLGPELVLLSPTLNGHLQMAETLDRAGIPYACFDTESFPDYLKLMEIFTGLTGRRDLYKTHALDMIPVVERAIAGCAAEGASVLLLRSSSVKIKALNSDTMVGSMLREFGCENIADDHAGLLDELSLEAIVHADPDFIFITCMGDTAEAKAQIEAGFAANPLWDRLQAVQDGRCFYLEKELFHYKPNARWGESYEKLAELLAEN